MYLFFFNERWLKKGFYMILREGEWKEEGKVKSVMIWKGTREGEFSSNMIWKKTGLMPGSATRGNLGMPAFRTYLGWKLWIWTGNFFALVFAHLVISRYHIWKPISNSFAFGQMRSVTKEINVEIFSLPMKGVSCRHINAQEELPRLFSFLCNSLINLPEYCLTINAHCSYIGFMAQLFLKE